MDGEAGIGGPGEEMRERERPLGLLIHPKPE